MSASAAPVTEYSDEAWARRVTGVTGQHVGRLRRVFQKFGEVFQQYDGLYWSHFQAALDWEDPESWLTHAAERRWSVSQMRTERWESLGIPLEQQGAEEDSLEAELDEDFEPALREKPAPAALTPMREQARSAGGDGGPAIEGPDFGDEDSAAPMAEAGAAFEAPLDLPPPQVVRPLRCSPRWTRSKNSRSRRWPSRRPSSWI
jgi:hypothetical protein